MVETIRRAREAMERARASSAPVAIAKRAVGENSDPIPLRSSEAIAKHRNEDERTTAPSPEPIAAQPAPIRNPADASSAFLEQRSMAMAARAPEAHSAPMELERRAPEAVTSAPAKKIEQRIADWCIAVGTALRGPWPDAVWSFYERMTDVFWWWRAVIRPPLKFLFPDDVPVDYEKRWLEWAARAPAPSLGQQLASWWSAIGSALRAPWRGAVWDFYERMTDVFWWWRAVIKPALTFLFPGCEPRPTKLEKAIRECFREFHENPPPWPPHLQGKKPKDADPSKET